MRSMRALLVAVLALSGCPAPEPSPYVEPPPTAFDFSLFPSLGGSSRLFAEVGAARLEFDPTTKDAISALGLCVDAATFCYEPGTSKDLSYCLLNTRTCAGDAPWNERACCPQACKDDFSAKVDAGVAPSAALEQVFFVEHTCFPGLDAALAGGAP